MRNLLVFLVFSIISVCCNKLPFSGNDSDSADTDKRESDQKIEEKRFSSIKGTWRLKKILCSGEESAALPPKALEEGFKGTAFFVSPTEGYRHVEMQDCLIQVKFKDFALHKQDNIFEFSEGASECPKLEACEPFKNFCELKGSDKEEYAYKIEKELLIVTMPEIAKATSCGPDQDNSEIQFVYSRESEKTAKPLNYD